MKQSESAKKLRGKEGFDVYYREIFGARWEHLKNSLFEKTDSVEYNAGGKESYFLDSASVRAAVSLPLSGAEKILDMCAAPGGKTVVIASCMEKNAFLVSNERSKDRKRRLLNSVEKCLPLEISERVTVTGNDGAKMCLVKENLFDRILLDAPCSSERHVLLDEKYLSEWSPARIKTLAVSQWALLSSAYRMLNSGGFLLYSTCALNFFENDGVVSRLLKKFPDSEILVPEISSDCLRFCSAKLPEGEKTEFGMHILPDSKDGAGPLYFSLIRKKPSL